MLGLRCKGIENLLSLVGTTAGIIPCAYDVSQPRLVDNTLFHSGGTTRSPLQTGRSKANGKASNKNGVPVKPERRFHLVRRRLVSFVGPMRMPTALQRHDARRGRPHEL